MGYVGASHIPDYKKDTHAEMLMAGGRAENGKGAEIVISDMTDLLKIIDFFAGAKTDGKSAPFDFPMVRECRIVAGAGTGAGGAAATGSAAGTAIAVSGQCQRV